MGPEATKETKEIKGIKEMRKEGKKEGGGDMRYAHAVCSFMFRAIASTLYMLCWV